MGSSRLGKTFNLIDNPDYTKPPLSCDAKKTNNSSRDPRQHGLEARNKLARKHEGKHQHQIQFAINTEMHSGKLIHIRVTIKKGSEALLFARHLFQGTLLTSHPFLGSTSGIQTFTMTLLLRVHLRKHEWVCKQVAIKS